MKAVCRHKPKIPFFPIHYPWCSRRTLRSFESLQWETARWWAWSEGYQDGIRQSQCQWQGRQQGRGNSSISAWRETQWFPDGVKVSCRHLLVTRADVDIGQAKLYLTFGYVVCIYIWSYYCGPENSYFRQNGDAFVAMTPGALNIFPVPASCSWKWWCILFF